MDAQIEVYENAEPYQVCKKKVKGAPTDFKREGNPSHGFPSAKRETRPTFPQYEAPIFAAAPAPSCLRSHSWCIAAAAVSWAAFGAIVAFLAVSPRCPSCPSQWLEYEGACYYFSQAKKNWTSSQEFCSAQASHLLVISTSQEMAFFQKTFAETHWIGLRKNINSDGWLWEGVSGISVKKVQSNSPVQHCGVVWGGSIHASSCAVDFPWICETTPK